MSKSSSDAETVTTQTSVSSPTDTLINATPSETPLTKPFSTVAICASLVVQELALPFPTVSCLLSPMSRAIFSSDRYGPTSSSEGLEAGVPLSLQATRQARLKQQTAARRNVKNSFIFFVIFPSPIKE